MAAVTTGTSNDYCRIWYRWVESDSTTAATGWHDDDTATSDPWEMWVSTSSATTTAEKAQRAEARRIAEAAEAERKREQAEADKRAANLLRSLLSPEQIADLEKHRRFYLTTESGQRYEIDCKKRMHNVFEVDANGKRLVEHCIYQKGELPLADNAAAQLLLLKADENEFKRISNKTRLANAI